MNDQYSAFPTPKGWFMTMTARNSDRADLVTYGPAPALYDFIAYLVDERRDLDLIEISGEIKSVPTIASCSNPVRPLPPRYRPIAHAINEARYSAIDDTEVYDSLADVTMGFINLWSEDCDVIVTASGGLFWSGPKKSFTMPSIPVSDDPGFWESVSRSVVDLLLKSGCRYEPVIIPGLLRQPIAYDRISTL